MPLYRALVVIALCGQLALAFDRFLVAFAMLVPALLAGIWLICLAPRQGENSAVEDHTHQP